MIRDDDYVDDGDDDDDDDDVDGHEDLHCHEERPLAKDEARTRSMTMLMMMMIVRTMKTMIATRSAVIRKRKYGFIRKIETLCT